MNYPLAAPLFGESAVWPGPLVSTLRALAFVRAQGHARVRLVGECAAGGSGDGEGSALARNTLDCWACWRHF